MQHRHFDIPIVVVAYNRVGPLRRLLTALSKGTYRQNVKLIISIDGGEDNAKVVTLSTNFVWNHGDKQIIVADSNLGLRKHVLLCGSLSRNYDGIVLLEDDLYVAPHFYDYALAAQTEYAEVSDIAGVALYSHQYNETAWLPFVPLDDGYDVFFLQITCSWGQCWTSDQWYQFERWYDDNCELDFSQDQQMPQDVRLWPDTSWKKYFLKYMIERNLYFVYPRRALSTNFADLGENHRGTNIFQVPLLLTELDYRFPKFPQSLAKYDAYCELAPDTVKNALPELSELDLSIDLYGMKNRRDLDSEYVLTSQKIANPTKSFGRSLKPHEMNVLDEMPGDVIHVGLTEQMEEYDNFLRHRSLLIQDYDNTHAYFYALREAHYKPAAVVVKELVVKDDDQNKSLIQHLVIRLSMAWRRILIYYRSLKVD